MTPAETAPRARATEFELAPNPRAFTLPQRLEIAIASGAGAAAVWLLGRSLRWEVHGWENWEAARRIGRGMIYAFWHREIFPATWFWRKRGIVVMTSQNFDGEYIARIIERMGYGAARGSSSRGAVGALAEMKKALLAGRDAAFTTDGPRGPRFVAKLGPVLLARMTGSPGFQEVLGPAQDPFPVFARGRVHCASHSGAAGNHEAGPSCETRGATGGAGRTAEARR